MSKKQEVIRIYKGPDAEMIESSKTIRHCFVDDKADFINFDPDFSDPYSEKWKADIEESELIENDSTVKNKLEGITLRVENAMEVCRSKFQHGKHFIEKAFPDNTPVWNEFGYKDYESARQNQPKMILFMQQFHSTALKYKSQLIPKNYSQAKIDDILYAKKELDDANDKQESLKKGRPVLTQERITTLNNCWKRVLDVSRVGKLIYEKDFAKHQKYVINPAQEEGENTSPPGPPAP